MPADRPPNLILLVTDQERAPQHWPDDPAWLDALMPNDAELRRTGMSFTRAFAASSMCSPSRASILTGTFPARHGVPLTLTFGDLFPDPRNFLAVARTAVRLMVSGEVPRAADPAHARPRPPAHRSQERPRARAAGGHPHAGHAAARARLPRRPQGQVAPDQAAGRADLDRGGRGARRAGLRVRRLGRQRCGRRRQARVLRRRRRRAQRRGLGRGLHAPDGGVAGPGRPARAVLPGLVPGQPARRAQLPRPRSRRAATPTRSSTTCTCRCRRRSTRTCATSRRCTR